MLNKLKLYLALISGIIVSIIAIFYKGISIGHREERNKQIKKTLDNVKKAKKTRNSITPSRLNKLYKKYNRK